MSYDISILVNGSRCKQYFYEGKTFIEAKDGSEYTIEIKNNTWNRVLAICSVDGLDILTGKKALESNPGYVISGHSSGKFDGFRVSDNKIAKFVFGSKDSSYAADKGDGSERNVGVIGVRLFQEKVNPPIYRTVVHHHTHTYPTSLFDNYPIIWCDSSNGIVSSSYSCDSFKTPGESYSCNSIPTRGPAQDKVYSSPIRSRGFTKSVKSSGFDMGTKWGEAKESKVINVEFERGPLVISTEIYYASRQNLIDMGVPIGNEKQVNFPEAFADTKYAKPPHGWNG